MSHNIFLDSGAPWLYHKFARNVVRKPGAIYMGAFLKDRKKDNFDWLENPEYLDYRERYVEYIKSLQDTVTVYTNLDIVNNPQATWENQRYLESRGLNPIPVWHFGSDVRWLQRYLKKGYDYIGIGGLVPNPYSVIKPALDEIFAKYLTDSRGYPVVKLHGFAATGVALMTRYPWYSVDSSSWIKYANYGTLLIPQKVRGEWRYTQMCYKINVSGKSPSQKEYGRHYKTLSKQMKVLFGNYVREMGFTLGKSEFHTDEKGKLKETIIEPGLCNRPHLRALLNSCYYIGLQKQMPEWPWPFNAAKKLTL